MLNQRYRLDAEIGRGGMGIIYRAHDIQRDRDVAIKLINANTANALSLGQFAHEAEISLRLNHPHIVTVYESGSVELGAGQPSPYLVMELIHGTGLEEINTLTYAKIIDISRQICEALAYIHEQGFVYRDLKPSNIILEKRGFQYFVKLLDLGLARPRGETYLPQESHLAGTAFYLAPELIAGQPADISTDLYALGVLLYELITGRVPFSDIDEQTVHAQHLVEKVSPPSQSRKDVPPALESIVLRLLEKNSADRFASAQAVLQALEQVSLAKSQAGNVPKVHAAGRDDEIASVIRLVEETSLLTFLNDDETLALAAASKLSTQFMDGAWLLDLQTVEEPGMLVPTALSLLGVTVNPDRPLLVSLIEFLREKNMLLLFSHYEQIQGACIPLISTILNDCPDIRILVLNPKPLGLRSEKVLEFNSTKNASLPQK